MLWENFPLVSRRAHLPWRHTLRDSLICIIYARKRCGQFPPRRRSIRNISPEGTGPYVKKKHNSKDMEDSYFHNGILNQENDEQH